MFTTQQEEFSIREFDVSDFSRLKEIAGAINRKVVQEKDYCPFYAFQVSPEQLGYEQHLSKKVMTFLKKAEKERQQEPRSTYRMAVCDSKGILVGNVTIDVLPIHEDDGRIVHGDLGYFLDPAQGGRGLMRKVVSHVLKIWFKTHEQLDITAHPNNLFSRRLIEHFNGRQVGQLQQSGYQQEPRAVFVMSRNDFQQSLLKPVKVGGRQTPLGLVSLKQQENTYS